MHLVYWVHHQTGLVRVALITLLILVCLAILVLLSEHSKVRYDLDELYGWLD